MPDEPKFTQVRTQDRAIVFQPQRNLIGDEETDEIERLMDAVVPEPGLCLIVDLSAIEWVNTVGLQAIIATHLRFAKAGAKVAVCAPHRRVRNVFTVVQLDLLFPVHESIEQALAACPPAR